MSTGFPVSDFLGFGKFPGFRKFLGPPASTPQKVRFLTFRVSRKFLMFLLESLVLGACDTHARNLPVNPKHCRDRSVPTLSRPDGHSLLFRPVNHHFLFPLLVKAPQKCISLFLLGRFLLLPEDALRAAPSLLQTLVGDVVPSEHRLVRIRDSCRNRRRLRSDLYKKNKRLVCPETRTACKLHNNQRELPELTAPVGADLVAPPCLSRIFLVELPS